MKQRRASVRGAVIILCGLVIAAFVLFPYLSALLTALTPLKGLYMSNQAWQVPIPPTLKNFVKLWSVVPIGQDILNSVVVCVVAVTITMVSAVSAAYALSHMQFAGRETYRHLVLATQMLPPVVLIIPLYRMVAHARLVDNLFALGVIDAAFMLPFTIWLLHGYFQAVPDELLDAATIDGCNALQKLWYMVLPVVRAGTIAAVVFAFAFAWNEFLFAFTLLRQKKVIAVGVFDFVANWQTYWPYIMGATLIATVPVLVLFVMLEKNIVEGLMEGAVR